MWCLSLPLPMIWGSYHMIFLPYVTWHKDHLFPAILNLIRKALSVFNVTMLECVQKVHKYLSKDWLIQTPKVSSQYLGFWQALTHTCVLCKCRPMCFSHEKRRYYEDRELPMTVSACFPLFLTGDNSKKWEDWFQSIAQHEASWCCCWLLKTG